MRKQKKADAAERLGSLRFSQTRVLGPGESLYKAPWGSLRGDGFIAADSHLGLSPLLVDSQHKAHSEASEAKRVRDREERVRGKRGGREGGEGPAFAQLQGSKAPARPHISRPDRAPSAATPLALLLADWFHAIILWRHCASGEAAASRRRRAQSVGPSRPGLVAFICRVPRLFHRTTNVV